PIIFLSKLKVLDLIEKEFKKIILPKAVYNELTKDKNYNQNIEYIKKCKELFDIRKVHNLKKYDFELHKGENEAIVLAINENCSKIFLDDYKARQIAKIHNLKVTGTIGILVRLLKKGYFDYDKFEKHFQELISYDFRIDIKTYNYILSYAKNIYKNLINKQ
ncbi:DUF3368 domain-containing protein, partial [Candidatus Woesearchaeota archaeon]|nr:DUF3368 domain-containing protein [Candidatus Woesearchaeota archaeon]